MPNRGPGGGASDNYARRWWSKRNRTRSGYKPRPATRMRTYRRKPRATGHSIKLSADAKAYLQAYGSPFTQPDEFSVAPRIPDTDFTGVSASFNLRHYETITADGGGNEGFIVGSSVPHSLGGVPCLQSANVATQPAQSSTLATYKNNLIAFMDQFEAQLVDKDSYTRYIKQLDECIEIRMVGAGIRVHDLGALQTQSGQVVARHADSARFLKNYARQMINSVFSGNDQLIISTGLSTIMHCGQVGTLYANSHTRVKRDALLAAQEQAGFDGNNYTAHDGVTLRMYKRGSQRPFHAKPRQILYPASETRSDRYPTDARSTSLLARVFTKVGAGNLGVSELTTTSGLFKFLVIQPLSGTSANTNYANSPALLLFNDGEVVSAVEEDNFDLMDGDAGLMMIQYLGLEASRKLLYQDSFYYEGVVKGDSLLNPTPSPIDPGWERVCMLADQFPHTAKGFSFFTKMWGAVKKSANWLAENAEKVSKVVVAGANVAKLLAP